jgi:hypothetical protein
VSCLLVELCISCVMAILCGLRLCWRCPAASLLCRYFLWPLYWVLVHWYQLVPVMRARPSLVFALPLHILLVNTGIFVVCCLWEISFCDGSLTCYISLVLSPVLLWVGLFVCWSSCWYWCPLMLWLPLCWMRPQCFVCVGFVLVLIHLLILPDLWIRDRLWVLVPFLLTDLTVTN